MTTTRFLAAVAAALALSAPLVGCGSSDADPTPTSTAQPSSPVSSSPVSSSPLPSSPLSSSPLPSSPLSSAPAASGQPSASSGGTPAAGPHDAADVAFATMMIPHHRQAVAMCDLLLAKSGIDAQTLDLARRIKAAQTPEVTRMSGWLSGWGQDPSPSGMGDMDGMGGGMSDDDMHELRTATGADATELFLKGMVKHHQGAVEMAGAEGRNGQNAEAKQLARSIETTQQAEIAEMQKLLRR